MNLYVIHTGYLKLDGGAMFGVVPKTLWSKKVPSDENNRCNWSLRCLLIEDEGRLILVDNGIGDKQGEKFFSIFERTQALSIEDALIKTGFHPDEVTDNFLTHLHFDHCGGGIKYENGDPGKPRTVFPNAKYWSNENHWLWATQPNLKERPSFLKENILPIRESGQLNMIDLDDPDFHPDIDIVFVNGHTDKQMLPKIRYKDHTIVFMADLLPSTAHIPLPYVMGYDTRPLLTIEEKSHFLKEAADNKYILFFEHDPVHECATVKRTEKGVELEQVFPLNAIL